MARTELVKCRVTPRTKAGLREAARRVSKSDSELIRGLIGQAIDGRSADESVRADFNAVRTIANALLDRAATYDVDPAVVHAFASRLHDLAERHLRAAP